MSNASLYSDHPPTTTQPPRSGELSFVKHVKNIGRAYRKQATVLVACYRERSLASKGCEHRSEELRKVSRFIDKALGFAAHASKVASEEVDRRFDKAVRELGKYEDMFHPNNRAVIRRMEEAKEKDMAFLDALAKLKEKQTDDWSTPPKSVNVIPLLDPSLRVVRMKLDPTRSSFSEIVWRLSRLRDRGRITPGQHPFFYRLPISENGYDKEFKLHPIEDFQAVFNHNVYVLVDKPGRIFIESGTRKLTFGNVWMPKHTLIFKDVFGTLVGEKAAGLDPQFTPDVRFGHSLDSSRAKVFPSSRAGIAPATRNDQLDVATGPNTCHSPVAAESASNWRELVHRTWNSRDVNVYISAKRAPRFDTNRVLPPRLPAVDDLQHTTINTINDDALLSIFSSYRLDDDENWNLQLRWCKLIHVCRRWRRLIYASPSHLDLHLLCTNGTPVADMLKHSPSLPLTINYPNTFATMTAEDEEGILLALQQYDRVRRIVLHAPPQRLHKFLTSMNENFLTLERLSILSASSDDARLVMPRGFQAAHLSHLTLLGVTLCAEPRSLASTVSLVSLTLTNLLASPYFPPQDLAAQLQLVPLLEELSISFSVPIPRFRIQMRGIESPITRATLPALKRFIFRGVSAYLEGLLARISAPCVRKFDVTLFNQLIFALPVLSRFIDAAAELRFPVAKMNFNQNSLSISISDDREEEAAAQGDRSLYVQVGCKPFDWQVSSAAQICNALWQMLPAVEELAIDFYEHGMPPEWRDEVDSRSWCDLLRPFKRVKKLWVGHALTSDLSRVLQPPDAEQLLGAGGGMPAPVGLCLSESLLPVLQDLVLEEGCDDNAFTAFIDARQRAGFPIQLVIRPSGRDPGAETKAKANSAPSQPRQRGGYISSQPMPRSLHLRLPGSYPASPMARLRLPDTAPISPISPNLGSTLCPRALGGVVEQYLDRLRRNYP